MEDSDGGWSEEPLPLDERRLGTPRYLVEDVLGEGGNAIVLAVYDARMRREVALKRARSPARAARVRWEAWIVAQLDHPSIISVYDGPDDDDHEEPFFTMPIVRGQSLASRLETGPHDLPSLLRSLLTVCEAVAYAHAKGVVHADLKPANVMLGEFAEVRVIDWGLAVPVAGSGVDALADRGGPPRPRAAGRVGTPGFMSPEQAEGDPPDTRSDVFALGQILGVVLERVADAPTPELRTILRRATDPRREARYDDAGELARDIAAYVHGELVPTHRYSAHERAGRFVRAHAGPLAMSALALLAILVVFAVGLVESRRERARAERAEESARRALEVARRGLASAEERGAQLAFERGDHAEAYLRAARALQQGESPLARGIVSAVLARPRFAGEALDTRGCPRTARLSRDGVLCLDDDQVWLAPLDGGPRRWRLPLRAVDAVPLDGGAWVVVDAQSAREVDAAGRPGRELVGGHGFTRAFATSTGWGALLPPQVASAATGAFSPCGERPTQALAGGADHLAAVCEGGEILLYDHARHVLETFASPFGGELLPCYSAAFGDDDRELWLGGLGGEVAVLTRATGAIRQVTRVEGGPVLTLQVAAAGVVVQPERGPIVIVDPSTGAARMTVPQPPGSSLQILDGDIVVNAPGESVQWRLARGAPAELAASGGLSSALVTPEWVAAAGGDGALTVWRRSDGTRLATVALPSVIKRLALWDGEIVAALAQPGGLARVATGPWALTEVIGQAPPMKRVAVLSSGSTERLLAAPYGLDLQWGSPSVRAAWPTGEVLDLAVSPDRRVGIATAVDGRVVRLRAEETGLEVTPLDARGGRDTAVAIANDGVAWAIARRDRVEVTSGEDRRSLSVPEGPLDVAFSPEGDALLIGTREGLAVLVDLPAGHRRAVLPGASRRVPWVGFDERGEPWTASWDGRVRRYSLRGLTSSAAELLEDATSRIPPALSTPPAPEASRDEHP